MVNSKRRLTLDWWAVLRRSRLVKGREPIMNQPIPVLFERDPGAATDLLERVPGILLLAVVGFAGKGTEQTIAAYGRAHHLAVPNIEYVL